MVSTVGVGPADETRDLLIYILDWWLSNDNAYTYTVTNSNYSVCN